MDREKVIKELTCCIYSEEECECPEECPYVDDDMSECQAKVMRDALALLKEQEAVVRCKDCKHWYFADNRIPCEQENICGRNGIVVTPDWFCADGERKEGR